MWKIYHAYCHKRLKGHIWSFNEQYLFTNLVTFWGYFIWQLLKVDRHLLWKIHWFYSMILCYHNFEINELYSSSLSIYHQIRRYFWFSNCVPVSRKCSLLIFSVQTFAFCFYSMHKTPSTRRFYGDCVLE